MQTLLYKITKVYNIKGLKRGMGVKKVQKYVENIYEGPLQYIFVV